MKRRQLFRGALGVLAGVGLAGCTGAGGEVPVTAEPPPASLPTETDSGGVAPGSTPPGGSAVAITDFGGREDADGSLIATVTVENRSGTRQVRLVRATIAVNDLQTSGERFVRLAPGEERTVLVHLDVGFEAWNASGSLTPQVIRRTPATPIPPDRETPTETAVAASPSPTPTDSTDTQGETGTSPDSTTDSDDTSTTEPTSTTGTASTTGTTATTGTE